MRIPVQHRGFEPPPPPVRVDASPRVRYGVYIYALGVDATPDEADQIAAAIVAEAAKAREAAEQCEFIATNSRTRAVLRVTGHRGGDSVLGDVIEVLVQSVDGLRFTVGQAVVLAAPSWILSEAVSGK